MKAVSDNPLSPPYAEAAEALDRLLASESFPVRAVAVDGLARLRVTTPRLVASLGDPDLSVARAAEATLRLQRHAVPMLLDHVRDPDARGRGVALDVVLDLVARTPGASPPLDLLAELLVGRDPFLAEAATFALARAKDPRAVRPLLRLAGRSSDARPLVELLTGIVSARDLPDDVLDEVATLECPPQVETFEEDRGGHLPSTWTAPAAPVDLAPLRGLVGEARARRARSSPERR